MKSKYKDNNNEIISYGDILKIPFMEEREKSKFSPKTPFAMLTIKDNEDMIYISGMDEFHKISELQTEEDAKQNKISGVEIFANRDVYNKNLCLIRSLK